MLLAFSLSVRASERVRSENGRWSIECNDASLQELLSEVAAVSQVELWLDEGLEAKKVSVSVSGVTMKQAVEKLLQNVKVNYVLYFDSANPEQVTKIYVGGGGAGRPGREPSRVTRGPGGSG